MDIEHLINSLFNLSFVVEHLAQCGARSTKAPLPPDPHLQLRWIRSHQQSSRDTEALCEAMAVLVRLAHGTARSDADA